MKYTKDELDSLLKCLVEAQRILRHDPKIKPELNMQIRKVENEIKVRTGKAEYGAFTIFNSKAPTRKLRRENEDRYWKRRSKIIAT